MSAPADDVKSIFLRALELPDPTARAAFLARECGENAALRAEVDGLLAALDKAGGFLKHVPGPDDATCTLPPFDLGTGTFGENPPVSVATADHVGPIDRADTMIGGKYTLVEVIGEGGMGSVWRAKQSEPVKRFVAIKLIKAGMDSKQVLARFEAERQALALMDHPNIAKVLDGGLHEQRPYFVMELVKGVPITEYCDRCKLTPRERLELFVPVCQAIQHAHQKGIIHRDIKPSNVLVALYDDRPVVKVIDFGVAKATGGALTEQSVDTGFGGVVGTPQYMSPEQATFNNLDIDTRSDVYALGVLLYELLAGSPPFAKKELERRGLLEILRVVREEEPPRPSTKLSTADALPTLSANRGTEPKRLTNLLRNELDWIVMKALEKDRTRRYESANGFAADVQRYLSGEAVLAHPPSTSYRLKKFARRNKGQVIATSLVLFALLAGMAGTTLGLIRADQQRQVAERAADSERQAKNDAEEKKVLAENAAAAELQAKVEAQADRANAVKSALAEKAANVQAQKRLAQNEKANEILNSVFQNLDPVEIAKNLRPLQAILVEQLDQALAQLDGESIGDPQMVASMQHRLGLSLLSLGEANKAIAPLEKASATFQTTLGPDHPLTVASMLTLVRAYSHAGDLKRAVPLLEKTLKLVKTTFGPDHLAAIATMGQLALAYKRAGDLKRAVPLLEEALKIANAKLGPDHRGTLATMGHLASAYLDAGDLVRAVSLAKETLDLQKAKLGAEHLDTLRTRLLLLQVYRDVGKLDLVEPLAQETLKIANAKLGPDHPDTITSMVALASAYQDAGDLDRAVPLFEEGLRLQKAKLGPDHSDTISTSIFLAQSYMGARKLEKAVPLFEEALKLGKAKLGPDHPYSLNAMNGLAQAYAHGGMHEKAMPLFEEAFRLTKAKLGPNHPYALVSMTNLAAAYQDAGKLEKAVSLYKESLELQKAKFGPDHPNTLATMSNLAVAYWSSKQLDKSIPLVEQILKLREAKLGRNHPDTLETVGNLGVNYKDAGLVHEAIPLLEEANRASKKYPRLQWIGSALLDAYVQAGEQAKLLDLIQEQLAEARKTLPKDSPQLADKLAQLANTFNRSAGKPAQAVRLYEEALEIRKAQLGPDHPDTLSGMESLAVVYWSLKQLDKSIPMFEETLKRWETKLGRDHPETLQTMANLGVNYKDAGRLKEAIPLLEEAYQASKKHTSLRWIAAPLLESYTTAGEKAKLADLVQKQLAEARKAMPKDKPQMADQLTQFANIIGRSSQGMPLAMPLYEEAFEIRKACFGPDHDSTLASMNHLARLYWSLAQHDKSVPLLEESLKRREAKFGRDHLDTLATVVDLGVNYKDAGRLKEAIPLLEEAHLASKKHTSLRWVFAPLLESYAAAGEKAKLADLIQKQLAEVRKTVPKDSPQLAQQLALFGLSLLQVKAFTEAELQLRECLAIREKKEPDVWATFNTQSMLGGSLLGQMKYVDAEPLLLKGYEGMKQREKTIPPLGMVRLPEALDRLIEFYTATNKPDEVKKWKTERAKYPSQKEVAPPPREKK